MCVCVCVCVCVCYFDDVLRSKNTVSPQETCGLLGFCPNLFLTQMTGNSLDKIRRQIKNKNKTNKQTKQKTKTKKEKRKKKKRAADKIKT